MQKRSFIALTIVIGSAVASPLAASAASEYHPAPTEAGVTYHPDHMSNNRTRAQIVAETDAARKHPFWRLASVGAPWPAAKTGPGRSRDEVYRETVEAMRAGTIPSGEK